MSTMIPDLVVGEVGFGPSFATNPADFGIIKDLRAQIAELEAEVNELEAQIAELIRHRNRLRNVLERCAALSPEISDLKHEVLLETAPKKH